MPKRDDEKDSVRYARVPELPGVEFLSLHNTARNWKILNTAFSVGMSTSWAGDIVHRRRREELRPGGAFFATAGEIHTTPKVRLVGNFRGVLFDPQTFDAYACECGGVPGRAMWSPVVTEVSPMLARCHADVFRAVEGTSTPLELQSKIIALFEASATHLVDDLTPPRRASSSAAERIRDCLNSEDGLSISLDALANAMGLSRFQVVRTFRARYGLPPHAYQVCAKVARASELLRQGRSSTEVAALCGFADQSHFGRHFRRLTGVTPGQYAKACDAAIHSPARRYVKQARQRIESAIEPRRTA